MILEVSDRCPASQHFLATVNGVERITWLRLRPRYLGLAGYHSAWRGVRGFGSALATKALLGTMLTAQFGEDNVAHKAPPSLPRPCQVPNIVGLLITSR